MTQAAVEMMTEGELDRARRDEEGCFGALETARGHLPLEAMDVDARVVGLVSTIELRQTFVNTLDETIEATYIFPLPDRAAVSRFRMEVNGRVIEGVIKERGAARREYTQAIQEGHRAAITEEERPGVFTMRVGNLMPGEKARVLLTLTGPVPLEEGDATFRFPLVVAPRYIPGTPLPGASVGEGTAPDTDAVPDASRISPPVLLPGYPNPVRLSLALAIDPAGVPMRALRSSLHAVAGDTRGDVRRVEVRPGERLDRDFIARWSLGDDAVHTSLVLAPDERGDEGTFLLTLVPPSGAAAAHKPRDVVFVLDRSGSMGGWKMVAARRAVARMVDSLTDADRFGVIAFDHTIEEPRALTGLVAASDRNRFRAVEFLAGLEARGGTEMAKPLERAAGALAGGYKDRDRVLVLATDGQVGNEDQILRRLSTKLANVRVFTLGIDRAVNAAFLKRLAAAGGGACELVESEDRLDEVMDKIHRRIGTPVVTELGVVAEGLDLDRASIAPARLPDLFAGSPVTITGRFRGAPTGAIALRGQTAAGEPWSESVRGREPASPEAGAAATKLWARARIRDLEDRFVVARGGRAALEKEIVATSVRFSVLSRFTAFLAVDRSEKVESDGDPHKVVQPVEMPSGWEADDGVAGRLFASVHESAVAPGAAPAAPPAPMPAAPMKTMMAGGPPASAAEKRGGGALGKAAGAAADGVGAVLGAPVELARALGRSARRRMAPRRGGGYEEAGEALDDATMAPYLTRLRDLAGELERDLASGAGDAGDRLRRLVAALRVLADDLDSIDGPDDLRAALRQLVDRLAAALAAGAPDGALRGAVIELRRLAEDAPDGPPAAGKGPARDEFWK